MSLLRAGSNIPRAVTCRRITIKQRLASKVHIRQGLCRHSRKRHSLPDQHAPNGGATHFLGHQTRLDSSVADSRTPFPSRHRTGLEDAGSPRPEHERPLVSFPMATTSSPAEIISTLIKNASKHYIPHPQKRKVIFRKNYALLDLFHPLGGFYGRRCGPISRRYGFLCLARMKDRVQPRSTGACRRRRIARLCISYRQPRLESSRLRPPALSCRRIDTGCASPVHIP